MINRFVELENDIIVNIYEGDFEKAQISHQGKKFMIVPFSADIRKFRNIYSYDHVTWKEIPIEKQIEKGFIKLSDTEKIEDGKIIPLTEIELYKKFPDKLDKNLIIDNDKIREKTLKEKIDSGVMSKDEANAIQESLRQTAYMVESDPLFFKFQRGEIKREEWLKKVQEIKDRYPEF